MSLRLLVSDDELVEIREVGKSHDNNSWWLGNKVFDLYRRIQKAKSDIVNGSLKLSNTAANRVLTSGFADAIKLVADESGKSFSTIRCYAEVAHFYSPESQEKYKDLPMSHFSWAMQYPNWSYEILDADLDLIDKNGGKPIPLRVLQSIFSSVNRIPEMLEQLEDMRSIDSVLALSEWDDIPKNVAGIPPLVFHFFRNIGTVYSYIAKVLDLWELDEAEKKKIRYHIAKLQELVQQNRLEKKPKIDKEPAE